MGEHPAAGSDMEIGVGVGQQPRRIGDRAGKRREAEQ